jgi:hypothetical protein
MDWITLAHDRDRLRALANAVMKLRVPGNSCLAAKRLASQEGLAAWRK